MSGPYETEADVVMEVGDIYAGYSKPGVMQALTLRLLTRACVEHGVELGEYDRLVLQRLAAQRPETAQVIASLIARAAAQGRERTAQAQGTAAQGTEAQGTEAQGTEARETEARDGAAQARDGAARDQERDRPASLAR